VRGGERLRNCARHRAFELYASVAFVAPSEFADSPVFHLTSRADGASLSGEGFHVSLPLLVMLLGGLGQE
jgi:hypothetical protein